MQLLSDWNLLALGGDLCLHSSEYPHEMHAAVRVMALPPKSNRLARRIQSASQNGYFSLETLLSLVVP